MFSTREYNPQIWKAYRNKIRGWFLGVTSGITMHQLFADINLIFL